MRLVLSVDLASRSSEKKKKKSFKDKLAVKQALCLSVVASVIYLLLWPWRKAARGRRSQSGGFLFWMIVAVSEERKKLSRPA